MSLDERGSPAARAAATEGLLPGCQPTTLKLIVNRLSRHKVSTFFLRSWQQYQTIPVLSALITPCILLILPIMALSCSTLATSTVTMMFALPFLSW